MKEKLAQSVAVACKKLFDVDISVQLSRPQEQFGDYATNVALQLAKQLGKNPHQVADMVAAEIHRTLADTLSGVSVAGPGFINLKLNDAALLSVSEQAIAQTLADKKIVTEYSDPNPFKVLHVGHLYTSVVGNSISNLLEAAGGTVHRTNFGGDVGLHVGRTMWAMLNDLGGEFPDKLAAIPTAGRSDWMARCYVEGTQAYETDEAAKQVIIELNKRVYQLHADNDHESSFAQVYWTCRQWSYDYFDAFYKRINTPFEKYYPESDVAALGLQTVREQLVKGVYKESDGAVVFEGEPYNLHTRVFINSYGLPTYEAKDTGLIMKKWQDYNFDLSVVITGNDITEYMKVVLKSIEQFAPDLVERSRHVPHGNVKMAGGVKMSSRKGNFLRATDVLDMVANANQQQTASQDSQVDQAADQATVLGAIKYAFLKQRIGADIIFSPEESVSLEGNSGPYLQYAHARACSILRKANEVDRVTKASPALDQSDPTIASELEFQTDERTLLAKISEYHEAVDKAVEDLMPHYICTYLYDLAQTFNRFYENNHVIGDPREAVRLRLVAKYAETLKRGLNLLGIVAPDKM